MVEKEYYTLQEAIEWIAFRKESDKITADMLNENTDKLTSAEQALLTAIKSRKVPLLGQFDPRDQYDIYEKILHPQYEHMPLQAEQYITNISASLHIYPESNAIRVNGTQGYENIKIEKKVLQTQFPLPAQETFPTTNGYTTPYLEIMAEVIQEEGITMGYQSKKEFLTEIIKTKMAERELRDSDRLASAMATLIRQPEMQNGRARKG